MSVNQNKFISLSCLYLSQCKNQKTEPFVSGFFFYQYNGEDEKVVQLQGGIYPGVKKMDS